MRIQDIHNGVFSCVISASIPYKKEEDFLWNVADALLDIVFFDEP